jgi:membrane protein implicated in regulation of membrane protease activity
VALLIFVALVAVFVILFVFLLPILYSLRAVGSLFVYPRQLKSVFGNRILRRNHALEHATIVVMMQREPGRRFNGFSDDDGFFVQGVRSSTDDVDGAAREALKRLRAGEKGLAIHRNCGTTIVAANMLAAVFFLVALGVGLYLGWPLYLLILGGVALSLLLRVPLSLMLQRFVTTDSDLSNAEVGWVEPVRPQDMRGGVLGILLAASSVRVRVFHTDPDAVEILRGDGAVVK